jgi:3-dehydroquinate synthase
VAFGLIAELYLSVVKCGFPTEQMRQTVSFIRQHYGNLPITCDDYDNIIALMRHDKKNRGTDINVTLLAGIGQLRIDQTIDEELIREALDFVREDF